MFIIEHHPPLPPLFYSFYIHLLTFTFVMFFFLIYVAPFIFIILQVWHPRLSIIFQVLSAQ